VKKELCKEDSKHPEDVKKTIETTIEDALNWLRDNQDATKEMFDEKRKVLEELVAKYAPPPPQDQAPPPEYKESTPASAPRVEEVD
jgi:hypothetical protein